MKFKSLILTACIAMHCTSFIVPEWKVDRIGTPDACCMHAESLAACQRKQNKLLWKTAGIVTGAALTAYLVKGMFVQQSNQTAYSGLFGMIASGIAVNLVMSLVNDSYAYVVQEDTVAWFVDQQLKMVEIFSDLKARTIDYDLHSSMLNLQLLIQEGPVQLKACMYDLCQIMAPRDDLSGSYVGSYADFLIKELKRKYTLQAGELELLQEYAIAIQAQKQRNEMQPETRDLFSRDFVCRKEIVILCNEFVVRMHRLLAFVKLHTRCDEYYQQDIVDHANVMLEKMEHLLNSSYDKLEEYSKQQVGMFTIIYEYERIFNQQLMFLNRYARIVQ